MLSPTTLEATMATAKKGVLNPAPEWWRHLRMLKPAFWKAERQAVKKETTKQKLESQG
jgi:hypothetical protein